MDEKTFVRIGSSNVEIWRLGLWCVRMRIIDLPRHNPQELWLGLTELFQYLFNSTVKHLYGNWNASYFKYGSKYLHGTVYEC